MLNRQFRNAFASCLRRPSSQKTLLNLGIGRDLPILRRHKSSATATTTESHSCTTECWNCGKAKECCAFFCKGCDKIQPVAGDDKKCSYFHLLQLPQQFNLEPKSIEQCFWKLQKRLHPDLYSTKSKTEQEISAQNSSEINRAYKALKSPTARVQYLLQLHGIDALAETSKQAVDPEILMETMEIREEIEDCTSLTDLEAIQKSNRLAIHDCVEAICKAYDEQRDLKSVTSIAIRLQYLSKIEEEILLKQDELE